MKVTLETLKDILYVKNNCTIEDLLEHLQFLRNHYHIENTRYEDIMPLLIELQNLNIVKLNIIKNQDRTPGTYKTKVFIEFEKKCNV